ncbi:expressed unknown protein [Seminavis robusta]|uniref:Aminoglycoside phosphotransferase domain-containing protein n=1 Tax=Seminavis robusta TaxID=568900 RepID=A0A9N8EVT6_9STRA|nr:expressed unknown protein [Seminavis robusta]|eukprot:Sro2032_g311890.1 n/a (492) ;mRNA; r:9946-11421
MCRVKEEKKEDETITEESRKLADQEAKLNIVLFHIAKHASSASPHPELRTIHSALQAGDKLSGKILSGGWTNYSYKIYLESQPDCRLFAKVCFAYALWDPSEESTYYDLDRQTTEFQLMEHFSGKLNNAKVVATPYLLLDVSDDLRIIVTEWASAEEQWANQFIDGHVDRRLLPSIAETMASIHLTTPEELPKNLNQGMKEGLGTMISAFDKDVANHYENADMSADACLSLLAELGQDRVFAITEAMNLAAKTDQSILGHADLHVFNILVESKPDDNELEVFGPKGIFCICDWEMAHWCPKGRDIGLLYCFPIAAAYFHATQGHVRQANDMIDCLREHWDVYSLAMTKNGNKSQAYLREAFRSVLGFCGMFLFLIFYTKGGLVDMIHKDGLSDEDVSTIMGLLGKTGLHFLEWSFMDDVDEASLDLEGLRKLFQASIEQDMATLVSSRAAKRPSIRRSSLLRKQGRRVSDASLLSMQSIQATLELDEDFQM